MKNRNWDDLTKQQKRELIDIADSLGIPPNFVHEMYENGQLDFPDQ
jgi:hypothetical protein